MAGTRTRPRGSPGQHARLWASKRRLLQPPSCTASGGPDFRGVTAPNGIHRWIRIRVVRNHLISTQASGSGLGAARGSTPRFGTQNSLPCIAWRKLASRSGEPPDFKPLPTASSMARGAGAAEGGARVAGTRTRPRGSPGQHARLWASKRRLLQPPSCTASGGPDFRGVTAPNGIHRWIRIRVVRNHLISTQASGSGLGAARGSTPRFGTQNSLPCIAWRSWRRGRVSPRF